MYINGENHDSTELGKLMHDFRCTNPDDMNNKILADRARYFKEDEEGVAVMCKVIEDMREETRREATDKAFLLAIKNLMENLKMSAEEAMNALGIAVADRSKYMSML